MFPLAASLPRCLVAFFISTFAFPLSAFPQAVVVDHLVRPVDAQTIQAELDARGFFRVPAGRHLLDRPITLKADQRLTGEGFRSVLLYSGPGEWAVILGDVNQTIYRTGLDSLSIRGGGVRAQRYGQHCWIRDVWISGAPGDGLRIDGIGDRLTVERAYAWENAGAGIRVAGGFVNNGITLDGCNAQGNDREGVVLETTSWSGQLVGTTLRGCTIQGNGRAGAKAEVLLRGWVHFTRIDNCHLEGVLKAASPSPTGSGQGDGSAPADGRQPTAGSSPAAAIRTEPAGPFLSPTGAAATRRPSDLWIGGGTTVHGVPRAAELVAMNGLTQFGQVILTGGAKIHWRSNPAGGDSTHTKKPQLEVSASRGIQAEAIIADPLLE